MSTAAPELNAQLDQIRDDLVAIRHDLHAHPQLQFEETHAAAVVAEQLRGAGIEYQGGIATTGVVGWILPSDPAAAKRPAIGLRADMDALPITEQTGLPYASKHAGCMHACGHDGHTTMLIGAARLLAERRDALPQPVKLLFQPAEEGAGGARYMVEAGVLTDRVGPVAVERVFGLHGWPDLPVGAVSTRPGPFLAATDDLHITVRGPGGHAASPHLAPDTVLAAARLINDLQSVVSRSVRPTRPAVLSVTCIHGGSTHNIIPAEVRLTGTCRTTDEATRRLVRQRVREIAAGAAAAAGVEIDVRIDENYPVTSNDADAVAHLLRAAAAVFDADAILHAPEPVMCAEDFAYYGKKVSACFAFLGTCPPDVDEAPGLHTPRYDFNDAAIPYGVKLLTQLALAGVAAPESTGGSAAASS